MNRFLSAAIAASLVLSSAQAGQNRLQLGISPQPDALIAMLGGPAYLNEYAKDGLDVELSALQWQAIPKALHDGTIDVAMVDLSTVIASHETYPDLVYWYTTVTYDNGFALLVRPDGKLRTVAQLDDGSGTRQDAVLATVRQLKGKTIVARAGGAGDLAVSLLARKAGLRISNDDASDIHIVSHPPEEGEKAFLAGEGDAYIGPVLQRTEAENAGMAEMIDARDLGTVPLIGFVTTRSYAAQHENELLGLLHSWFRVTSYVDTHRAWAGGTIVDLLARYHNGAMSSDDFLKDWQGYEHFMTSSADAAARVLDPAGPDYWQARQQACNEYYCSIAQTLPEPVSASDVFMMPEVQQAYVARYGSGGP